MEMNEKREIVKLYKERGEERDRSIAVIKRKLQDPYLDDDERFEILDWFRRFYSDEAFKTSKSMQQWFKDLKRLANGE